MNLEPAVFNPAEPLADYNVFDSNRGLRDALNFNAPALANNQLPALGSRLPALGARRSALGEMLLRADMQTHARLANRHPPTLQMPDGCRPVLAPSFPERSPVDRQCDASISASTMRQ